MPISKKTLRKSLTDPYTMVLFKKPIQWDWHVVSEDVIRGLRKAGYYKQTENGRSKNFIKHPLTRALLSAEEIKLFFSSNQQPTAHLAKHHIIGNLVKIFSYLDAHPQVTDTFIEQIFNCITPLLGYEQIKYPTLTCHKEIYFSLTDIITCSDCKEAFDLLYFATTSNPKEHHSKQLAKIHELNEKVYNLFIAANINLNMLLQFALDNHIINIALFLIKKNPTNINMCSYNNCTLLHLSTIYGDTDAVRDLLNIPNINLQAVNKDDCTALYVAANNNYIDIVNLLLQANAEVQPNNSTQIPLIAAARNGHTEILIALLTQALHATPTYDYKSISLFYASYNGHSDTVSMLLQSEANVNYTNNIGLTPLMVAARNGHIINLQLLLAKDLININHQNQHYGNTALLFAIDCSHFDAVNALLQAKANANLANNVGQTPLLLAIAINHTKIIDALIAAGADLNATLTKILNYPNISINDQLLNAALLLITLGANPNIKNSQGLTILNIAAHAGKTKVVKKLLRISGINVNACDGADQTTPLIAAVLHGSRRIVKALLAAKDINIHAKDINDKPALFFAHQHNHTNIAALLEKVSTKVNTHHPRPF